MADATTDILMRVVGPAGPMRTDSPVKFDTTATSDNLMFGFQTLFMSELREFDFEVGAPSSLDTAAEKKAAAEKQAALDAHPAAPGGAGHSPAKLATGPALASTLASPKNDTPDMQPIEFTRLMDSASIRLMNYLTTCTTLPSISIVKRKAAGTRNGGEAYLRLDFSEVLLIALSWKESSDLVEETGSFNYRKLTIRYRPQAQAGALQPADETTWTMTS